MVKNLAKSCIDSHDASERVDQGGIKWYFVWNHINFMQSTQPTYEKVCYNKNKRHLFSKTMIHNVSSVLLFITKHRNNQFNQCGSVLNPSSRAYYQWLFYFPLCVRIKLQKSVYLEEIQAFWPIVEVNTFLEVNTF